MVSFASLGFHDHGFHVFVIDAEQYEDNYSNIP